MAGRGGRGAARDHRGAPLPRRRVRDRRPGRRPPAIEGSRPLRPLVLVAGSIASNYRNGGIAWERLSWILGLERVGVDVFVVDQLDSGRCVFEPGREPTYDNALNVGWFDAIVERFGLTGRVALIGDAGQSLRGPPEDVLRELAASADALVNVAGNLRVEAIKRAPRRRILVDVDPGLTQLWLASGRAAPRIVGHDLYFTIGENVGRPGCPLPTAGIEWRPTRQPVLLDQWPVCPAPADRRFTTVARWRGAGPHGRLGEVGLAATDKGDEFLGLAELPSLSEQAFELALAAGADPDETEAMTRAGWTIVEAEPIAAEPESFRDYVQGSAAECSVAKGAYVHTYSGWFSDRTTRYLASGRPALVQDTGFARNIPCGEGLLAWDDVAGAAAGARRIAAEYADHALAARRLAEQHFAAEVVLSRFIDEALGTRL